MQSAYRVFYYPLQLLLRLGIVYALFSLCRLVFYGINASSFPETSGSELATIFWAGLRFDTTSITYVNALFILSYLLPFSFRENQFYQKLQLTFFLFFNFLAILLELIDIGFFRFSFKRSVGSDLEMIANSFQVTPRYLLDYWYLTLALLAALWLMYFLYQKAKLKPPQESPSFGVHLLVFLLCIPVGIIAARGGLQSRPITAITATEYVEDMSLAPIVSNTTLNIIFSVQQKGLEVPQYFSSEELKEYHSGVSQATRDTMRNKNIVLIVLESFGKDQVGYFNPSKKSNTPFLDSLIEKSWIAEESYANGFRSTHGIVALSAGIPPLMKDALMFSNYQSNRVYGLAAFLKNRGYTTGFFHGCNPGSMEFEKFAKLSGFEHFYDRTAYPDQSDYDGNWGIWDGPYFQFFAETLQTYTKPFFGLFFSMTSHHPFAVEADFAAQHPDLSDIDRCYLYTDFSLQQFFETAKTMPWFSETLFIITADHVAPPSTKAGNTRYGRHRVPILFYDPSGEFQAPEQALVQQIDLLPTVLEYLQYDEAFSSFGQSIFNASGPRYAYMYSEGWYQILDKQYLLMFDGKHSLALFDYQKDVFLEHNLIQTELEIKKRMETKIKAIIQRHHYGMVNNQLQWEE